MADFDDDALLGEFLAAAGVEASPLANGSPSPSPETTKPSAKKRKNPPKSTSSKTKRRKRSSDSESDVPEISDDELEDIAITPPPRGRRGNKEGSPEEEENFEHSYPLEGKYKDEADRERLLGMTEVERESVLFARAEEIQRYKEKEKLAAYIRQQQAKDQPRRSGREGQLRSEKAGKRDELSELKKRREEKSNAAKVKTPTKSKFAQDDDDGSSVDSGELSEEDTKRPTESSTRITFSNVGPITLTRQFFAKYCHYPQFESAITGCFTRVRVSEKENDYRFARIEGLVTVSKYTVEGAPVDQGLELSQGSSKKVINMDFASNSLITEREFERYVEGVKAAGTLMPSKKHLDKKLIDVNNMRDYKLTDADITAMIIKKKSLSRIPKNIVHEKTRLKQLHLAALSSGNESEADKIQEQLAQLEELAQGKRVKEISKENEAFMKVNERNRKINIVEMREAERRGAEERRRNALSTDLAVMDPFSRRKTIPKTFYENLASSRGASPAPSSGVNTPMMAATSVPIPDTLVLDAAAGKGPGKAVKVDDVIAQADFGIDIEI